MARDPVCGMNVKEEKNGGLRSEYKGQSFYFCSDKCQKEFDKNPSSFARDKGTQQNPRDDKNQKEEKRPR